MPGTYLIRRVQQVPSLDTARAGQMDTWVTYTLTAGPLTNQVAQDFVVKILKGEPTEAEITAAVETDARVKSRVLGKTGTV